MSKLYDLLAAMCGKIKKPDWNQNDTTAPDYVKNRPFYDARESVTIEWDGNTEGRPYYNGYKVSNLTPSKDALIGSVVANIQFGKEYTSVTTEFSSSYENQIHDGNGWFDVVYEPIVIGDEVVEPGVYFAYEEGGMIRTKSLTFTLGELKQIDTKYLPDEVVGNFVITVSNGENGPDDLRIDKTMEEIVEAFEQGKAIYLDSTFMDLGCIPLGTLSSSGTFAFYYMHCVSSSVSFYQITISSDGSISFVSSQNVPLTTAQINALDGMFKVCAFIKDDVSAEYAAFCTAFGIEGGGGEEEPDEPVTPEVTLTSISATYNGGDVAVGTAVTDLTGIVVTAHYSDGTSKTVTGYTLSGEIAEDENTITVIYQGKTATFTVNGIAESTGENKGWVDGEAYAIEWTDGYGIDQNPDNETFGEAVENSARSVSNYLPCLGASAITIGTGIYKNYGVYFYDGEKKLLQRVNADPAYPAPAPLNAHYVRVQCLTPPGTTATVTPITYAEHSDTTMWTAGEYFSALHDEVGSLNITTGVLQATQTGWRTTGFVFCFGAETLKVNAFTNQYRSTFCFYDADKNFISGSTATGNSWTIPENAQYFRHSTINGDQYNNGSGHNNPWFILE